MKIYDYKLNKSLSWCFVLCMSLFVVTNSFAQIAEDIVCDDQVNISVGADCTFDIVPGLFTEGLVEGEVFQFSGTNALGQSTWPMGGAVDLPCGTYTVTVTGSGNNCWGTVVVEDKLPPTFINPCPGGPGLDTPCTVSCFEAFDLEGNITIQSSALSALITSVRDCSGPVEYIVDSEIFNGTCDVPGYLSVRVEMIDQKGNQSEAILYWEIIDDFINPPLRIVDGECGWNESPNSLAARNPRFVPWINTPSGPSPVTLNAARVFEGCNKLVTYDDLVVPACGGEICGKSRKIIRTWRLIDWCGNDNTGGEPFTRTLEQIISLKDEVPPTVYNSGQYTTSVDPWSCEVEKYRLPDPDGDDNCMGDLSWNVVAASGGPSEVIETRYVDGHWYAFNMPKGLHTFIYWADDCCNNEGSGQITVLVKDKIKPVAITKQFTVISLANVGGNDDGIAKMYAQSLDNGSYDHCTDVKLEIRRDGYFGGTSTDLDYLYPRDKDDGTCYRTPYAGPYAQYPCEDVGIGNDTYRDRGGMDEYEILALFGGDTPFHDTWDNSWYGDCNADVDPDNGEYVKFCCDDIYTALHDVNHDGVVDTGYVKVWLRVWDDANMDGIYGNAIQFDGPIKRGEAADLDDDDNGGYEYWIDNYNEAWGYVKVEVAAPPVLEVVYDAYVPCDWPYQEKFDEGYFLSEEWLDGKVSATGICDVEITVDIDADPEICPGWYFTLYYTATNKDTKGLTTTREMHVYVGDPDDYLRCGDVYWPAAFTEVDCADDLAPATLDWDSDPCDLIGWSVRSDTFIFGPDADACRKIVNEYTVIDWCKFDYYYSGDPYENGDGGADHGSGDAPIHNNNYLYTGDNGYFEFEGGNDYFDGELCRDPYYYGYFDYDDSYSENGVLKYIEIIKVIDKIAPVIEETDQTMYEVDADCYATVKLVNSATDEGCQGGLTWEVSVDWDRDGYWDRTYTRDRFNSKLTGTELDFVLWDIGRGNPERYFRGPMYSFDVEYKVFDGCGNIDKEVSTVMVVDKKDPTPYCIHLSSAVMESGSVELWAVDFDRGSFDNCYDRLYFTFEEEHPVLETDSRKPGPFITPSRGFHYFKGAGVEATEDEYLAGDAQIWWNNGYDPRAGYYTYSSGKIFNCDDVAASPVDVRMTVWDGKLNSDWCSVELTLIDNQGVCGDQGPRASVSGNVATEESSDVSLVDITLENLSNPEYELTVTTGNDGDFAFASNPMYNGYDISAVKDGDDTEGVSTLDLVHIQRHILGITPFESAYKVIAADINSDRRVSGTDLVVLRKVILGIYKEFPTNNSWRFVEKSQTLTVENALTDFNEVININDLDANMLNEDFVAVKIGDVNATAKTNARDLGTQTRSAGTVTLELTEQNVRKGDLVDLTFSSKNFNEVYGYQFTLELDGLTLEAVAEGSAIMTDANIGVLDNNTLTVSYSDISGLNASDNMFTLTVKATKDGAISNMIALTNTALNSEAYIGTGLDINTVELTINGEEVNSFRLDQNEPNPFDEITVVGFVLPEAGNATLTVYNVAGKMIRSVNNAFAQGYNEVKFTKDELNTTGVLYYTLKSGDFTATKKMIIIE